jgi:hypothetical protein
MQPGRLPCKKSEIIPNMGFLQTLVNKLDGSPRRMDVLRYVMYSYR